MAVLVWLHRLAPKDVDPHWALTLHERCKRYQVLPGTGGAYDQDEYLMAAMENAAGVSWLFDADAQAVHKNRELHTRIYESALAIIEYVNAKEPHGEPQS